MSDLKAGGLRASYVGRTRVAVAVATVAVLMTGCTDEDSPDPGPATVAPGASPGNPTTDPPPPPPSTSAPQAAPTPRVSADDVRADTEMAAVRQLAGRIGPRPGTSPAYHRAARWVGSRFTALGWTCLLYTSDAADE